MPCNLAPTPICIRRGSTVNLPLRPHSDRWRYVPIATIDKTAPVAIHTTAAHDIPDQWKGVVVNAAGMTEINATRTLDKLRDADWLRFDVVDSDTVKVNSVNAIGFGTHTATTGQIVIPEPLDLSPYNEAFMRVVDAAGVELAYFTTADNTLEIDAATDCIWLRLTAVQSAALTWDEGQYDIKLRNSTTLATKHLASPDSTITVVRSNTIAP